MASITLNGELALAYGALHSGVRFVTGYPGSSGTKCMEALIQLSKTNSFHAEVLILEESEDFLETQLKAVAFDSRFQGKIYGKQTGNVPREGELYRWKIQECLMDFIPGFKTASWCLIKVTGQ